MDSKEAMQESLRIWFQKNKLKIIGIGIIMVFIGYFFGVIVMNIFPQDEIFNSGREETLAFNIFALSRLILYGGLGLILVGILLYIVYDIMKPY
jgi:hypothetical protein